ncbi:hypothetical protein ACFL0S_01060 [Thermodesulfobacteriota bacterium]
MKKTISLIDKEFSKAARARGVPEKEVQILEVIETVLAEEKPEITVQEWLGRNYDIMKYQERMWETWLFCDENDIPLPDNVRQDLRKYAQSKLVSDTETWVKRGFPRQINNMMEFLCLLGFSETDAAVHMSVDLEKYYPDLYPKNAPDPESIRRAYQRYKKKISQSEEE